MDQQKETVKNYIIQQLQTGLSADAIADHLRGAGWSEENIRECFSAAQQHFVPQPVGAPTGTAVPASASSKKGRIKTGWILFKQSMIILKGNKQLLRYLIMTAVWVFAITIVLVVIYIVFDQQDIKADENSTLSPLGYVLGFINYLLVYFFINYYAAGLTANVLDIFQGQSKPYASYMAVARSKIQAIFIFSLLSATVGMFLHYVVERIRFIGFILSWLLGTMWSLGTLFVIPLIVSSEHPSGITEIKQSVSFFKQTWGENITTKVSVNLPLFLIDVLIIFVYTSIVIPSAIVAGYTVAVVVTILFLIVLMTVSILGSFANSIVNVALFYFATHHEVPPAFDAELLNKVFITHKRRFFSRS